MAAVANRSEMPPPVLDLSIFPHLQGASTAVEDSAPPPGASYDGNSCGPAVVYVPPAPVASVVPPPQGPSLAPPAGGLSSTSPAAMATWRLRNDQLQLRSMGWDVDTSGQMTAKTRGEIIRLQESHGLPATGRMDDATRAALASDVTRVQNALAAAGYPPGSTDGRFGAQTTAAVRQYQLGHGITPADGKMNVATWQGLFPETAEGPGITEQH